MWKIPDSFVIIIITFMAMMNLSDAQPAVTESVGEDYRELTTKRGSVFTNVVVKRVETSALVFRHNGGVAKVSFFDLSPSVQARFGFDPVAALRSDRMRSAEESERQKSLALERQRRETALKKAREEIDLIQLAQNDWVPVEATVVNSSNGGNIVRAKRITLVPTQIRSTLGFLKDGPPKKVLQPFIPELLLLIEVVPSERTGALKPGDVWKGFLNPVSEKDLINSKNEVHRFPAHRGVARMP